MKKINIEKELKNELRKNSVSDFSGVWNKCDVSDRGRCESNVAEVALKRMDYKRLLAISLAGILILAFALTALWRLFAPTSPTKFSKGYFVLDINPSIEVSYDENGVVTSTKGLNDDGKALLVGMELAGKDYGEATEKLLSRCLSLGYFSVSREDNAILATALTDDGQRDEKMTSAIKTALVGEFSQKKIKGVVIDGVTNPSLQAEAEKYGIDGQKYGLILSYLALGGQLEESEYATLSIRELYSKIEEKKTEEKNAQAMQSQQVLDEFEVKLYETLTEQISTLVETLGVYLSLENETQEKLNALQSAVANLENAEKQWQRKKIIEGVLVTLDELKALQLNPAAIMLVEGAKMSINVVYQFFEQAFYQLLKLRATPEQISFARLKKFSDYTDGTNDFNSKTWQETHQDRFMKDWFALKEKWELDRKQDF